LRISKERKRRPGPMEHPELSIGEDAVCGWTIVIIKTISEKYD
jgi:hypothetical protein